MRIDFDLALSGPNTCFPRGVETTTDAVAAGRVDARSAEELGVELIHIADPDETPPALAVTAARRALTAAGLSGPDVGLLLHCSVWHQGWDMWSPAHHIAARIGADAALPIGVNQGCNAVMAAVELAAPWLAADRSGRSVMVTAGDRFLAPGFDRWRGNFGFVHGDAATAAVLRRGPVAGALAVRAVRSRTAPHLEEMNRAGLEPTVAARMNGDVDLRAPKKAYFMRHGLRDFEKLTEESVRGVIEESLADAGVAPDDARIRGVAVPRMSEALVRHVYAPLLSTVTPAPVLPMQRRTGHLACSDVLANVADLHVVALDRPGDVGVVLNIGGGYTWSALVVEVPGW
ncbi:ketoacyl-ACP synthase III family protein [Virgisporangium aurantiacum]|uniref:Beta-ketoacyl-[acyl-carrier-protein] synthase III N-terminal domain-containing protein n=1 Tax=Virgisporangium aurantiacum TaxID=175570 RepID=A0A8J4E4R7_9ACTN|nr:ketoacyl-ACP synthase III family protein [Virgisporangium aurantiacum]GIJ62230.1 hypothetical protein Vau01_097460 [Virgisporangium aurantiacum]